MPAEEGTDPRGVAFAIVVPSKDPPKKEEKEVPEKPSNDEALANAKAELKADTDELVGIIPGLSHVSS